MTCKVLGAVTAAVLAAIASSPAMAATLFVAISGVDAPNCGTSASPCRTIGVALAKANPGDTVLVRSGTYAECVFVDAGVTLKAEAFQTSQTIGSAILDGTNVCDGGNGSPLGPVAIVLDRSSLSGFAVKHGGDSAVWGFGAVSITSNVISSSTTSTVGGGIFIGTGPDLTDPPGEALIDQNTIDSNSSASDGGGVFVDAWGDGLPSRVVITRNTVTNNTAGGDGFQAYGGGISVFTDTSTSSDSSIVTIKNNTVSGNTAKNGAGAAYGGGIFVATREFVGAGTETVTIGSNGSGNTVLNNVSEGNGGGISVNLQPVTGSEHSIIVEGNTVTANTGEIAGGGVHAFAVGLDLTGPGTATLQVQDNTIAGNHALGAPGDPSHLGGGGLFAEMYAQRTAQDVLTFDVARNRLTGNDASTVGGGASLLVFADDDPFENGTIAPADATLRFTNNLLASNTAHDAATGFARGGGAYALVAAYGDQATAAAEHDFLTVSSNATDTGAGGLEWDAISGLDSVFSAGATRLSLTNSIVVANQAIGVGGGVIPGPGVTVDIAYDDAFGNTGTDWEAQLGVTPATPGVISVNPNLDGAYAPLVCSPVIDAGEPGASASSEPQPNGGLVNLGHLGGTSSATQTFPDVNSDGTVDGLDVMGIAVSFNSITGTPRYFVAADRDLNGIVDGADLSYVSAFYAQSCPE